MQRSPIFSVALAIAAAASASAEAAELAGKALIDPVPVAPVTAGDGAVGERFGAAFALAGATLVVAVPNDRLVVPAAPDGVRSGSVLIYGRDAAGFVRESQLKPPSAVGNDLYGFALALEGDTLVVGMPAHAEPDLPRAGIAYVYRRGLGGWTLGATLHPAVEVEDARYGWSVAIANGRIAVGAPNAGSVSIYEPAGDDYALVQTLAKPGIGFGAAVAADDETLFVGAPQFADAGGAPVAGAVFRHARTGTTWNETATLQPTAPATGTGYGRVLAYADAVLAVGAAGDGVFATTQPGRAFVYDVTPVATTLFDTLAAPAAQPTDRYGVSVAVDGIRLVVGAVGLDAASGRAFVYARAAADYVPEQTLAAPAPEQSDFFGVAAAIEGDRIVVGADLDKIGAHRSQGSAQVFERDGAGWERVQQLDRGSGAELDRFGAALAFAPGWAFVGAPFEDTVAAEDDAGTVGAYRRTAAGGWALAQELEAPDAGTLDLFGWAVDATAERLVVGAPKDVVDGALDRGSAYVFRREGETWVFEQRLTAAGLGDDFFGAAVAIDGDRIAVGVPGSDETEFDAGAVVVFERNGAAWQQTARIAGDWPAFGEAGIDLDLDGDVLAIAAPQNDGGGFQSTGAVRLYRQGADGWSPLAVVVAPTRNAGQQFGTSVALVGSVLAVGAPGEGAEPVEFSGAAYVYDFDFNATPPTSTVTRFAAAAPAEDDQLGSAVAYADGQLLVGVPFDDDAGTDAGQALLYVRSADAWSAPQVLAAPAPQAFAGYGSRVAVTYAAAAIGEPGRDGENPDEGVAYLYRDDDRVFADGFEGD